MRGHWIQVSKRILNQLKKLEEAKDEDRLELVRSMQFALGALEMSLTGWKKWVSNPDIMTKFTERELRSMNKKLIGFARSFIKHDIQATELGVQKGLETTKRVKKRAPKREASYVA